MEYAKGMEIESDWMEEADVQELLAAVPDLYADPLELESISYPKAQVNISNGTTSTSRSDVGLSNEVEANTSNAESQDSQSKRRADSSTEEPSRKRHKHLTTTREPTPSTSKAKSKPTCHICGLCYVRQHTLNQHILLKHKSILLKCTHCSAKFSNQRYLQDHARQVHSSILSNCAYCLEKFVDNESLRNHMLNCSMMFTCDICGINFRWKCNLKSHVLNDHTQLCNCGHWIMKSEIENHAPKCVATGGGVKSSKEEVKFECKQALGGKVKTYYYRNITSIDPAIYLSDMSDTIVRLLNKDLLEKKGIKWFITLHIGFEWGSGVEMCSHTAYFRARNEILISERNSLKQYQIMLNQILQKIDAFQNMGSGWVIKKINCLDIVVAHYQPLYGSSYIKSPDAIAQSKTVLNIINNDEKCFLWCIIAYRFPQHRDRERVSKYEKYVDKINLNMKGIKYPVSLNAISKFEKNNAEYSINVFSYDKNVGVYVTYLSNNSGKYNVDLLHLTNESKQHYCLIKKFNALNAHLTNHDGQSYYCRSCLHRFISKTTLHNHKPLCRKHEAQKVTYPEPGENILKFHKTHILSPVPFRVYADFECLLINSKDESSGYTRKLNEHKPCGFAYVCVDIEGNIFEHKYYRGPDVINTFFKSLFELADRIKNILKTVAPMTPLTLEEQNNFNSAIECNVCRKPLNTDRVRDHCHITGKYRQALHSNCNLNLRTPTHIPIFIHNLKRYDAHFIIRGISKCMGKQINCIAKSMEEYISFQVGNLRFLDSYQFMASSLDKLVQNLAAAGRENFKVTLSQFPADRVDLLLRKGVYPYEYMDDESKFNETQLPPQEAFFSTLTQEMITDSDYEHAHKVWSTFQIQNLGEYHDLYVQSDVFLLCDVFENFRKLCFKNDGIEVCHMYTAPGLAYESCLRMTDVELELITDPNMFLFIERGIRGGIAMVSHRYAQANNKYLKSYDSSKPSSFIMYWDCTNLYGHAMRQVLPTSGFKWLSEFEIENFDVNKYSKDGDEGFILEVDLDYPSELHNLHNAYPVCAEHRVITQDMVSPYCREKAIELGLSTNNVIPKLVPNLDPKRNYVIHFANLQQALSLGLKLVHIHRILRFNQSPWMRPFVDYNTEQRKVAKNDFEKDFYKLKINSMFGKTMENVRKRVNLELVTSPKRIMKLVASPAFKDVTHFNEDLVAVRSRKALIHLDKPIYTGLTVLELSKNWMLNFHYNFVMNLYGAERAKLILTDTDSLVYHIQTEDIYEDLKAHSHLFDNSVYETNHQSYNPKNKKVVGTFKDEHSIQQILELSALSAKLYSIKEEAKDGEDVGVEKKVAKGVVRATLKHHITHQDYLNTLFPPEDKRINGRRDMFSIKSIKHKVYTICQNKQSLSPYDNKRFVLSDGVSTLAHGHNAIAELNK